MLINNTLNDNVLESMLVTLDRTHILALTYLIHENIYKKEDIKRYLENRTYYPRETELLNAISNAVSDNEDINLFAGLSTALSKLKRPDTDIDMNELAKKIKNARITVNPASVKETSDRNKNPVYTFPEFELIRGQYSDLFKYVNRPMKVEELANILASLPNIDDNVAKKYTELYQRLYVTLENAWSSYPWYSTFYDDFYKTKQYHEGYINDQSKLNNIPIYDNDEYSGLLNVALFELYKYTQNPSGDNSTSFGMLDSIIDDISNALSEAGIKPRDKRYNILDRMIQQNIGCSLNYSIGLEENEYYSNYRYIILTIPERIKESSIIYSANIASLFAIMCDSRDTESLPDNVKSEIKSTNCNYVALSNFDNETQKIVASALSTKRVAASELMDMPVSLYPAAVSSSLLSLMNRFVVNDVNNQADGYNNSQLLKRVCVDSDKYTKIEYVVDMPEESILTFLENVYTIEDEPTGTGYHEISLPGRCSIIGVINKIIKNFIDPKNFSITMAAINESGGIEMIKDKISKIKADIYQNFTLDPFTRSELPVVAIAYEILINYLNYLVVGNTVYNTANIDVFSNEILKNYSFNPNNTPETETDFRILVSNHIYKPYKYLYFMKYILMNVPILEDYMNSNSEILSEYREFLNGTAFRSIVKNLSEKYDATYGGDYWKKIYDMNCKGRIE